MIRKVYLDFIRKKLAKKDYSWLLARVRQYALIHMSYFVRRPLCGPILGTLVTNYRCNYHCKMCDLPLRDKELAGRGLKELETNQMKSILEDFARLGSSGIGFTGGEPLLRKDIFELLAYTKRLGMISHLNTNGFYLDEQNARNIIEAGVDSLNISLDGAGPMTHDAIRRHDGAFERVVGAIEHVVGLRKKMGAALRIKTVAVLDRENIAEVPDMIELARDLKVDCIEFIPRQEFNIRPQEPSDIADSLFLKQAAKIADYLLTFKSPGISIENSPAHIRLFMDSFMNRPSPVKCYAGYNSLAVDCYGEIYPCVPWVNWRRAVGNIGLTALKEIWFSSEYNRIRKDISACRKCYLNCQTELNILSNPFNMVRNPNGTVQGK